MLLKQLTRKGYHGIFSWLPYNSIDLVFLFKPPIFEGKCSKRLPYNSIDLVFLFKPPIFEGKCSKQPCRQNKKDNQKRMQAGKQKAKQANEENQRKASKKAE